MLLWSQVNLHNTWFWVSHICTRICLWLSGAHNYIKLIVPGWCAHPLYHASLVSPHYPLNPLLPTLYLQHSLNSQLSMTFQGRTFVYTCHLPGITAGRSDSRSGHLAWTPTSTSSLAVWPMARFFKPLSLISLLFKWGILWALQNCHRLRQNSNNIYKSS